ncbi:MAG: hypothetical protein KTR27_22065, partial [Leptolyngbyaceae cyanobacterium MAG.088]|nr:hypothetical protein [Leptolyngbyaceae cyanobacterium MAG.088]
DLFLAAPILALKRKSESAKDALQGLEKADKIFAIPHSPINLGHRFHRVLAEAIAPTNTQLKIFEYSQTLEVLFPPLGWKNKHFFLALLQTVASVIGTGLAVQAVFYLWPQFQSFWQRPLMITVSVPLVYITLSYTHQGLKDILNTLFQQTSIQLLPDIILLGRRFPCRPVNYQINTYKQDIEDIDLQPGKSTIIFRLRQNRTIVGKLEHKLTPKNLGVTPSEICWVNNILQLWLKQSSRKRLV